MHEGKIVEIHGPKRADGSWSVRSARVVEDRPHEGKMVVENGDGVAVIVNRRDVREGWAR